MGWRSGLAASLDSLWFFSLHADELATVLGARAFTGSLPLGGHERGSRLLGHLPVTPTLPANGRPRHCGASRRTASCRRAGGAGPLPDRTVASVTKIAGRVVTVPVEHQPWPLWSVRVDQLNQDVLTAAGLPAPHGEPLATTHLVPMSVWVCLGGRVVDAKIT
jgi:hypothetical protein